MREEKRISTHQPLSVFIITQNNESHIRDCLESIKWVDEIVVVDSFSSDRTVEICREYTDKIFQHKLEGFGFQRNLALGYTTSEWTLSLDVDERVTKELKEEIRETLKNNPDVDGYFIPRRSHFLGQEIRHCGLYPDYRQVQLFRKDKMEYEDRRVHEGYVLSGKTARLKEHILHYSFRTVEEFVRKMNLYSS